MDNEILYKSVRNSREAVTWTDYYIIPESISADYCDLKCYGIKIQKTVIYSGGGKMVESRQLNNVFYKYGDAEDFLKNAIKCNASPSQLNECVEKYIIESIDRARETA